MTLFDVIAVIIILVSTLVGFSRGGVREVVTVFAFTFASMATVLFLPAATPLMRDLVHPTWAATAAAAVAVFILAFIALRLAAHLIIQRLHAQPTLGAIDRALGAGFGLVRALVFLGLFYLVFNLATPPELLPGWISQAKLYPLSRGSAQLLQLMAPKGLTGGGGLKPVLERVVRDDGGGPIDEAGAQEQAADAPSAAQSRSRNPPRAAKGYDKRSRDGIDALVERSR